jgi:hypothetical protein
MSDPGFRRWFDAAVAAAGEKLSPGGAARRAAMRTELAQAVVRTRRRRQAVRGAAAGLAAAILLAVAFGAGGTGRGPEEQVRSTSGGRAVALEVVRDDPGIVARLAAPNALRAAVPVDDRELLRLLHEAGRPTGFVRVADRAFATDAVVDPVVTE